MQRKYQVFYDEGLENILNSSNQQYYSENQDFVFDLYSQPFAKSPTLHTDYKTYQTFTNPKDSRLEQPRQSNYIEISPKAEKEYKQCKSKKNSKQVNLNKFIKIKTLGFLKMLQRNRLIEEEQNQVLLKYQNSNINYECHEILFKIKSLESKCLQLYKSAKFAHLLLNSQMSFSRKIIILKAFQQLSAIINKGKNKQNKQ